MTIPDLTKLAATLTKAQRAAILRAEPDGHLGMWFIRWWQAKTKTLASLRRRGFAATVWSGVMLTPLGRVLRAHLKEQNNEN